MWTDEARQASAAARSGRDAMPLKRMGFGIAAGGPGFSGKPLGMNQPSSAGARAASDMRAAMTLGQGHPKSATVATPSGHQYNAAAVNAAIASSNRSGRRIGGREASLIHRLLRG